MPASCTRARSSGRLNEGLPQKGKQSCADEPLHIASFGLNEGLPQKGKQYRRQDARVGGPLASMKGFPRRGSN